MERELGSGVEVDQELLKRARAGFMLHELGSRILEQGPKLGRKELSPNS